MTQVLRTLCLTIVAALMLALPGWTHPAAAGITVDENQGEDILLATVNGEPVSLADLVRLMQQGGQAEVLKKAMKSVVVEKLYLQEGVKMGFRPEDISASEVGEKLQERVEMVEARLGPKAANTLQTLLMNPANRLRIEEDTRRQIVVGKVFEEKRQQAAQLVNPTAQDIDAFIKQFGNEVSALKLRGILVDTKPEAEVLLEEIKKGADFAELARTHSLDESNKDKGGDMGEQTTKDMGPIYNLFLKDLKDGGVSEPIKTEKGQYTLIKVEGRKLFKDDAERLIMAAKRAITAQKSLEAMEDWTQRLAEEADIQIKAAPLAFPMEDEHP